MNARDTKNCVPFGCHLNVEKGAPQISIGVDTWAISQNTLEQKNQQGSIWRKIQNLVAVDPPAKGLTFWWLTGKPLDFLKKI